MPTVRIRMTASDTDTREMMNLLQSLEGIERVEEISDMMPHLNDDDSSSAGLSDLEEFPDFHDIEIEAPNDNTARRVREIAEAAAFDMGAVLEFVDEF